MHVEIRELSLEGKDALVGTLRLVNGKVVAEPAERQLVHAILAEPVYDPKTKEVLTATDNPEEFLRSLPRQYKSAYLRAILVEE